MTCRTLPLFLFAAIVSSGCVSMSQTENQVAVRPPGARTIKFLADMQPQGKRHLEYARLSFVSYKTTDGGIAAEAKAVDKRPEAASHCPEPEASLRESKWTRWPNFPSAKVEKKILDSHLRVEVWQKNDPPEVVVTFGGTVFDNRNDWLANLRWFIPFHEDQYTEVVKTLVPDFITEFKARKATISESGRTPTLIATGHSLGGGLAQQFAYALEADAAVPRVSVVYAFHPSPVTGYFSVEKKTRDDNAKELVVERIYERSEILALLRSVQSVFFKPSESNPEMTGYRYSVVHSASPVGNHSLGVFTCNLYLKLNAM